MKEAGVVQVVSAMVRALALAVKRQLLQNTGRRGSGCRFDDGRSRSLLRGRESCAANGQNLDWLLVLDGADGVSFRCISEGEGKFIVGEWGVGSGRRVIQNH